MKLDRVVGSSLILHHRDRFHMSLPLFLSRVTSRLQAFDGAADAFDALFDVALGGKGEAQAQVLLATAVNVERLADYEGDPLACYFAQQGAGA